MICKYFVIIIELMTYTLLVVLQRLAGIKEDWFSCEWMYRLLVNSWNRSILNDTHKSLYTKMSVEAYLLSYKQFNFRWRQNSIFVTLLFCSISVSLHLMKTQIICILIIIQFFYLFQFVELIAQRYFILNISYVLFSIYNVIMQYDLSY